MKVFKIQEDVIRDVIDYLAKQPYEEVYSILDKVRSVEEVKEEIPAKKRHRKNKPIPKPYKT